MGLTWNCLGDSITDNMYVEDYYFTYIEKRVGNMEIRNYGIAGTRIAGEAERLWMVCI